MDEMTPFSFGIKPCTPPRWISHGQLQTIMGHLLPSKVNLQKKQPTIIPLPDGDRLYAEYLKGSSPWIIYLFHGLCGDTNADYMQRTAAVAQSLHHGVFLVNHRDCGQGYGLAKHPYHSGRGEDISTVLEFGRKKFPDKKHMVIGFSLSGNALLTLLTHLRGTTQPDRAISVNAPIDLDAASQQLTRGFNRVYDLRFVWYLRRIVQEKIKRGAINFLKISRFATVREFDALYTAPYSGFQDREDYYASCSTHLHLSKITVPTLLLTAKDDPFVPIHAYEAAKLSPSITLHMESCGGHLGYLSTNLPAINRYRWLDYVLREALMRLPNDISN
jgi:predicted alpha/beta-fold hydrolase